MFAVVDLAKAEARIHQFLAVRRLGEHAEEIMNAIKACSEAAKDEAELPEALGVALDRRANERKQVDDNARVRAAERAEERESARAMRVMRVISKFRPLLTANLPSDEARAFFDELSEAFNGPVKAASHPERHNR
jgi:hypothetical protein